MSAAKFDTSYQTRIFKARSQQERDLLKQLRLAHVEKQRNERINYSHREAAMSLPDHILLIKRDGMDQSKTNVPLYARRTSDRTIGIRLVGVKVHGQGDYVYLVDLTVCGGANLMIEIHRLTVLHLQSNNKLPTKKTQTLCAVRIKTRSCKGFYQSLFLAKFSMKCMLVSSWLVTHVRILINFSVSSKI